MSASIACPNCAATLKAPDEVIGKKVKCPKCHESFTAQITEQSEGVVVLEEATSPPFPPAAATQRQQAVGQSPVLTMPARQCARCGYQGYMVKRWDSWVVPVAIVVAVFTAGLGLLILLVPKKHCCPQCSAMFE